MPEELRRLDSRVTELGNSQPEPQVRFGHPYSVTQIKVKQINSEKQKKTVSVATLVRGTVAGV